VKGELPRCVLTATDQLLIVVGAVLACIYFLVRMLLRLLGVQ